MTAQAYIDRIMASLEKWKAAKNMDDSCIAGEELDDACDPDVLSDVLAHIDQQAAEIERLRELADSEGTRAVKYLRRARKAEADRTQQMLDTFTEVLLCDFCGCETPDPWHGSTETDRHVHACDACKPKMLSAAPQAQPERKPMTEKEALAIQPLRYRFGLNGGAGPISERGWGVIRAVEAFHGIKETP